jgi:hypothetical protein
MLLEEYRTKVIERLRACGDTTAARGILAEADLFLTNSRITVITRDKFWETLQEDLEVIREESKYITDRQAAATLGTVASAALARIARYRDHTDEPTR